MTAHNFNVDRGSGPHCAIARRDSRAMWGAQTSSKHHFKATTSGNNDWALGTSESVDPSGVNKYRSRFFSSASAEVLCTECRPKCYENDRDGCLRYLPPAVVRERPEPDHCDACHLPKTATLGVAGLCGVQPVFVQALPCRPENRSLCVMPGPAAGDGRPLGNISEDTTWLQEP